MIVNSKRVREGYYYVTIEHKGKKRTYIMERFMRVWGIQRFDGLFNAYFKTKKDAMKYFDMMVLE